jgi:hypothetical protein
MPATPRLEVTRDGDRLLLATSPDQSDRVEGVVFYASLDGAYTFQAHPANREGQRFRAELTGPDSAVLDGVAAYAEVEYTGGPVLTSIPWFGRAFRQVMRPFPEPDES